MPREFHASVTPVKGIFQISKTRAYNREYTPFSILSAFFIIFCLTTAVAFLLLDLNVREHVRNKPSVERAVPRALLRVISLKPAEPSQIKCGEGRRPDMQEDD